MVYIVYIHIHSYRLRVMDSNSWLRIQYTKTYKDPITEFQIAECEYESPEYLVIYIYIYIHMTVFIVDIKEVHESEVQSDFNNEGE